MSVQTDAISSLSNWLKSFLIGQERHLASTDSKTGLNRRVQAKSNFLLIKINVTCFACFKDKNRLKFYPLSNIDEILVD